MTKFSDIIGGVLRNKTGMPQKIETFKGRTSIYKKIETTVDEIEEDTIRILEDEQQSDWILNTANDQKLRYQFVQGNVSEEEYIEALNLIREKKDAILGDYIDMTFEPLIVSSKEELIKIQKNYQNMPGISQMDFSTWANTKTSAEIAKTIRTKIECGEKYVNAKAVADAIWQYQRDSHLRR